MTIDDIINTEQYKCVWKRVLQDKKSTTAEEVKKDKKHPLYPCILCTGYNIHKCLEYR